METNVFGREIARVRKAKRITQEELGRRVGLKKSSISKIETGRTSLTWDDASILLEAMGESMPAFSVDIRETEPTKSLQEKLLVSGIEWFASAKKISYSEAYRFLLAYKGLEFLSRNYRLEQTLPKETIIEDLKRVCMLNGGEL